ncbi:MAG: nucleoside hydrolase [Oscillospiraceae bacterium]|nr:nucleoside hydrolase [Oscillospiraceae bacterium]
MAKIPVLLDGDPGHDDVMAMVMALASDKLDVKGMTVVAGNSTLANTSTNALRTLEWLGMEHIPVCTGANRPLMRPLEIADSVHGESGLDGPTFPPLHTTTVDKHFCDFMADIIKECDEKVVLVAMGPLTNTAIFLLTYPQLHDRIERIVSMGGAAYGGNWSPTAEFNIWEDAEAAHIVYASGIPVTMCGLDATNKARVTKKDIADIAAIGTKGADLVAQLCQFFADNHPDAPEDEILWDVPMHDAVTIATLISDDVVTLKEAFVTVDIEGVYTQGCTTTDFRLRGGKKPNTMVAVDLDREKFVALLADACRKHK